MMKRVLVLTPWWPTEDRPNFGVFVREHVAALVSHADHIEVHVLALLNLPGKSWVPKAQVSIQEGQPYTVHLLERRSRWQPLFYRLVSLAKMDWQMLLDSLPKGYEPDAIWMNVCYPTALAWHVMPKEWRVKPSLLIEHWTGAAKFLEVGFAKGLMPGYLSHFGTVAFVSATFGKQVGALYPISEQQVIANVIDTELFKPSAQIDKPIDSATQHPLRMLSVMELGPNKAPEVVLAALLTMTEEERAGFRWLIVGEGPKKVELANRAREASITIEWLPRRKKEEIATLMQSVDILVHPAYVETFGVVVAEGLASGLTVLASALPVLEELAGEGRGLLLPNEAIAWKKALLQCLVDKQKGSGNGLVLVNPSQGHHQWVASRFSQKAIGARIASALAVD